MQVRHSFEEKKTSADVLKTRGPAAVPVQVAGGVLDLRGIPSR